MLLLTQVCSHFLACYASLMVPAWCCVNILSDCPKMCQECKRRLKLYCPEMFHFELQDFFIYSFFSGWPCTCHLCSLS